MKFPAPFRGSCRPMVLCLTLLGSASAWATGQAGLAGASTAGVTSIEFQLQPRDPQAAVYTIHLLADGDGTYRVAALESDVAVHAGRATMARVMGAIPRVQTGDCETREKNIAQTGHKTMIVEAAGSTSRCSFNFSGDSRLMDAVAAFEAVAETLQAGERLDHLHRFDRLGLDAEMDRLSEELADGRAVEPGNIAPVLRSLAEDDRVIDRVRRKAQRLLTQHNLSTDAAVSTSNPR